MQSSQQRRAYPSDVSDDEWAIVPPWYTVYQQTQRWVKAKVFAQLVDDLRRLLRELAGRKPQPSVAILDARTLQSTPDSGARAGYDGHKKRKGSKVHLAVESERSMIR